MLLKKSTAELCERLEEKYQNCLVRESMTHPYNIKGTRDYGQLSLCGSNYNKIFRFILSRVNRPYDDVYSEFIDVLKTTKRYKDFCKYYGYTPQETFKNFFVRVDERKLFCSCRPFVVVDGIIKKNEKYFSRTTRHRGHKFPAKKSKIAYYTFRKELLSEFPEFGEVVIETLGKRKGQHFINDKIYVPEFNKWALCFKNGNTGGKSDVFYALKWKLFGMMDERHPQPLRNYHQRVNNIFSIRDIGLDYFFTPHKENDDVYVKKGTSLYKKLVREEKDKERKEERMVKEFDDKFLNDLQDHNNRIKSTEMMEKLLASINDDRTNIFSGK